MKFYKVLLSCLFALGVTTQAQAINVIDQNQPSVNTGTFFSVLGHWPSTVQSFQQTSDNISGVGIKLFSPVVTSSASLTISLFEALPTKAELDSEAKATVTLAANGSVNGIPNTDADGWLNAFWDNGPVDITPDTTYYLRLDATENHGLLGDLANPYDRGDFYEFHTLSGTYVLAQNLGRSARDITFRTYTSVVPVPAAVWLFGSGLIGLIGMRRKSKNSV